MDFLDEGRRGRRAQLQVTLRPASRPWTGERRSLTREWPGGIVRSVFFFGRGIVEQDEVSVIVVPAVSTDSLVLLCEAQDD